MKGQVLALFSLFTVFCVMQAFSFFQLHLGDQRYLEHKNAQLQEGIQRERLRRQVALQEYREYQQSVAEVLPHLEGRSNRAFEKKRQARSLASVTLKTDEPLFMLELSGSLFGRAKDLFKQNKYNSAEKMFSKLIAEYPFSEHIVESHFLLVESRYKVAEYRKCLEIVEAMMKQFPSHQLTGYVMLRMGQIFEKENRLIDAGKVYQTVKESFSEKDLKMKAVAMLKNLEG